VEGTLLPFLASPEHLLGFRQMYVEESRACIQLFEFEVGIALEEGREVKRDLATMDEMRSHGSSADSEHRTNGEAEGSECLPERSSRWCDSIQLAGTSPAHQARGPRSRPRRDPFPALGLMTTEVSIHSAEIASLPEP